MPEVVLCGDGIEMAIDSTDGLWVVLRTPSGTPLGRFPIDPSELRATVSGRVSYQATDGGGNSVGMEAGDGNLKIRLEGRGHAPKNCRLPHEEVEGALKSIRFGV